MIDNLGGKLGSFDRLEKGLAPGAAWTGFDRGVGASAVLRAAHRRARAPRRLGPRAGDRPGDRPDRSSVGASGRSRGLPASAPSPWDRTPRVQGWRSGDPSCVHGAHAGLPATRRPQGGHAPRKTIPRRPVAPAGACARGERARRGRAEPPRYARPTSPAADISRTLAVAHLTSTLAPDLPQYLPTTWCGTRRPPTTPPTPPSRRRSVRSRSSTPTRSDQPDDFGAGSDALQTDVSRIEQYLALQTGGRRALRFDMGTECGPQYVDIQVVALPRTAAPTTRGDRRRRTSTPWPTTWPPRRRRARATCSSSPTASPTPSPPTTRRLGHRAGLRRRQRPAPATSATRAA